MKQFDIARTPTFLIQDFGGRVHRKLIEYIPVDDFLAQLKFGNGYGRSDEAWCMRRVPLQRTMHA